MTIRQSQTLTIFYDGQCPLCIKEMEYLKRCDKNNLIGLVDIHQNKLMEKFFTNVHFKNIYSLNIRRYKKNLF